MLVGTRLLTGMRNRYRHGGKALTGLRKEKCS